MSPAPYTLPSTLNRRLVGGIVALHVGVLVGLPFLLQHTLAWAALLLPLAVLNITHWALIHEAIHKLLQPDPARNETLGRLLSILMGTSFHVLRFGHLMHHKLNRDWHSEWVSEYSALNRLRYYAHLLWGLYGAEVLTSALIALLPKERAIRLARRTALKYHPDVAVAAERFFYTRGYAMEVRHDMALTAAIYGAAFWHFTAFWPVLLGFIALRAVVISFMDNMYHYGTAEDNSKAGKELTLAPRYARLMLNGNYHETHHLNPEVPWTSLPACHNAQGRIFNGRLWDHGLRQWNGPLQSRKRRTAPYVTPVQGWMPAYA